MSSALPYVVAASLNRWPPSPRKTAWRIRRDMWLATIAERVRARVLVETGVFNGRSSLALLAATKDWQGRLYSIDKPLLAPTRNADGRVDPAHVPNIVDTGNMVPRSLRDRWTLIIGDSAEALPRLLGQLGSIDLFFHDSEHSKEVQAREYREAWRHLRPGGALISDDIDWTTAFAEFAAWAGRTVYPSYDGKQGVVFR